MNDGFILQDWIEFVDLNSGNFINIKRSEVESVMCHPDNTTEINMKSGHTYFVKDNYEKVMKML